MSRVLFPRSGEGRALAANGPGIRSHFLLVFATLVYAAICSVVILHPFTPDLPQPGLDPSWVAVTGEAAAARVRWGIDIIFAYGPAGPLVTTYFTTDYWTKTLPLLLGLAMVHGLCAAALLTLRPNRSVPARRGWRLLGLICYAVALVCVHQTIDAFFFSTIFLVFLLDLQRNPDDRSARIATILGIVAVGIFCLSKLSFAPMAVPLFAMADLRSGLRRRLPFRLIVLVVAFIATDLAYGQHLADLPTFLRMQKDFIAGYPDAMSVPGPPHELIGFVLAATGLFLVVSGEEFSRRGPWIDRLVLPAGLALFLFLVFKAGFVRHDLHSLTSWVSIGLVGLLLAFSRLSTGSRPVGAAVVAGSLFALLVVQVYMVAGEREDLRRIPAMIATYQDLLYGGAPDEAAAMLSAVRAPAAFATALEQAKADAWAEVRRQFPLPRLDGPVDIVQSNQTSVMANGLDYRPRPTFQEYSDYTAEQMRINRAFYEGDRAPDWVLFAPGSIDNRYPAFAEGSIWPDFLRLYEPQVQLDDQVALHRRAKPLGDIFGTPSTHVSAMNAFVPLGESGPLFARITVKPTLLGRLIALVYRSPLLAMVVRFKDGSEQSFRFIPAMGAEGFVLSPFVNSADDFARLAFGNMDVPPHRVVTEVEITGSTMSRLAYSQDVTFEFTPFALPPDAHSLSASSLPAR